MGEIKDTQGMFSTRDNLSRDCIRRQMGIEIVQPCTPINIKAIEDEPELSFRESMIRYAGLDPTKISTNIAGQALRFICYAYSQPPRAYHTMAHIEYMMRAYISKRNQLGLGEDGEQALVIAIYYHDLIQTHQIWTMGSDTGVESLSAEAACCALKALNPEIPQARISPIRELIYSTSGLWRPRNVLEEILHDLDWAILGAETYEEFKEYRRRVESECVFQTPLQIANGSCNFMRLALGMASNQTLYMQQQFQNEYGPLAVLNCSRYKEELENRIREISDVTQRENH